MKKGVVKGSPMDIARDFATVPVSLGLGVAGGLPGCLVGGIAAPYIARSVEGARMGQFTSVLVASDILLSAVFGIETGLTQQ